MFGGTRNIYPTSYRVPHPSLPTKNQPKGPVVLLFSESLTILSKAKPFFAHMLGSTIPEPAS